MNGKVIALMSIVVFFASNFGYNNASACPCYSKVTCSGTCLVGTCVPIPTSLVPVGLPKVWIGWKKGPTSCGICWKWGIPLGIACGPKLCSEVCP